MVVYTYVENAFLKILHWAQFHHLLPKDERNCITGFTWLACIYNTHQILSFCWLRIIVDGAKKSVLVDCLFGKEIFSLGPRTQAIRLLGPAAVGCAEVSFYCQHNLNHLRVCFVSYFQMSDGVSLGGILCQSERSLSECSALLTSGNPIPCFLYFLISLEEDVQHCWLLSFAWSRGLVAWCFSCIFESDCLVRLP